MKYEKLDIFWLNYINMAKYHENRIVKIIKKKKNKEQNFW